MLYKQNSHLFANIDLLSLICTAFPLQEDDEQVSQGFAKRKDRLVLGSAESTFLLVKKQIKNSKVRHTVVCLCWCALPR